MSRENRFRVVVLISADEEWRAICKFFPDITQQNSPYGEWFYIDITINDLPESVAIYQGGWGKIAAAASTQYVIDRWSPSLLVNLGTCGGFENEVERDTIILVERTLVYDLAGQMADADDTLSHYTTELDISWLSEPYPLPVRRSLMVSGDRDLHVQDISRLQSKFGAVAGDWESAAIAYVAKRNRTRCLIIRGVSDLVCESGGEVYGNFNLYAERSEKIMRKLIDSLPAWIAKSGM